MKKHITLIINLFFGFLFALSAQIPERPSPPRLVNDFAHILTSAEINNLERKLVNYNDTTSTQIAVVTVSDIAGMDVAQFGTETAHKWEIGQKGKDNGVLLLIKAKTVKSRGQANIAVGYGLEEFIPDATAKNIIEYEMLPFFKEGRMYDGIDAATSSMMSLLSGEFSADQYNQRGADAGDAVGIIVFLFIIGIFMFAGRARGSQHGLSSRASGFPWWIFLFSGGGRSSGSGWSDFSGGSGSFGGGGFGGFGGGGFGGGGASGSW
ncbi:MULTISPECIES: YgcG family protein [unclassified Lentimicrobium]|uniref:TPM domain-containing protein n=1 Tax=unclassified Lentimicrobium TaxID=2677434 RepID=UPI001C132279|nr:MULTISPECIES: TPM domain-containing protein [unclassified Lentimicrobium]